MIRIRSVDLIRCDMLTIDFEFHTLIAASTSLCHKHEKNSKNRVRTEFLRSTGASTWTAKGTTAPVPLLTTFMPAMINGLTDLSCRTISSLRPASGVSGILDATLFSDQATGTRTLQYSGVSKLGIDSTYSSAPKLSMFSITRIFKWGASCHPATII